MNKNQKKWIMVLGADSKVPFTGGAYRFRSLERLGETRMVPF